MRRLWITAALALLSSAPAWAVDVEIRYGVLERLLSEQAFTVEGRRYVQGAKDKKCDFAYLEKPRLSASGDRLQLQVSFSGKKALDMFGHCVGLGDSFDLVISAKPVTKNGEIAFENFIVQTPRDSYYIGRVRKTLAETLNHEMKLDIMDQTRKLIEAPQQVGSFHQEIKNLQLGGVRVTGDSLVLMVDFKVIVK